MPGEDQDADPQAEEQQQTLRHHQQLAAIEAIGDPAGDADQHERRAELQGHRHAHRGGVVVGELGEDDPAGAVACIQAPMFETSAPMNHTR